MSDTTPTAPRATPRQLRRPPTKAEQIRRLTADTEALAELTEDAARHMTATSFAATAGCADTSPARECAVSAGVCVHVTCDLQEARRTAARTERPREIDIAVTVHLASSRTLLPHRDPSPR